MEFTILMPCLNESSTIAECITAAQNYITDKKISADIIVVDNGSTDNSAILAEKAGATVITCPTAGYGNALRYGIDHSDGQYVIFGDCDCSYDFSDLDDFVNQLRHGADIVIGDRFSRVMEDGAMSFSHRYIGVPILSFIGRIRYKTSIHDFHCGLRGINKASFEKLGCVCSGMEFATEMIGKAALAGYRIDEVAISFHKDKRSGKNSGSHLRTIPDGIRHLKLMLR